MASRFLRKESRVGSKYQAVVEEWDAGEAAAIDREVLERERGGGGKEGGERGEEVARGGGEGIGGVGVFRASALSEVEAAGLDEYWQVFSALNGYSHRPVTQEEAVAEVVQGRGGVKDSVARLLQLMMEPAGGREGDEWTDRVCTVCGDGGEVLECDRKGCVRVYHSACVGLPSVPSLWECPVHRCVTCGAKVIDPCNACRACTNAYCEQHIQRQRRQHHSQYAPVNRLCKRNAPPILLMSGLRFSVCRAGAAERRGGDGAIRLQVRAVLPAGGVRTERVSPPSSPPLSAAHPKLRPSLTSAWLCCAQ